MLQNINQENLLFLPVKMKSELQNDLINFSSLLEEAKLHSISFLDSLQERKTTEINNVKIESELSNKGLGTLSSLKQFEERFNSSLVASSGPRYWGYVTGGTTPASIVGDWLASVFDQNTQGATMQGDISAIIEFETINLVKSLFNLPKEFFGGFVTGATMSNFTCLGVARQWFGNQIGKDFAKEGVSKIPAILSSNLHSSSVKSLSMLGIGSANVIKVNQLNNREAIDIENLEEKIYNLKGEPFILISSAGTVNTVDYDNFKEINKLRSKYNFWWHIDAAFGAFAACSDRFKHLLEDWDKADSITIDCHKWLNVPYESAFFLVNEKHKLLQLETFQNSSAPYLGNPKENFNYLNFLPENSRRLKALPVWFTLKAYGREGYKEIVEKNIEQAHSLASFIEESLDFYLLSPIKLNTVCFTLSDDKLDAHHFLKELNNTQQVFMTPTFFNNKKGIRAALVNWRTSQEDVDFVINLMKKTLLNCSNSL